ncbi:MAG: TMEM165/GDT1 family protein [Coriobacteriia bacterium]
MFAAFAGTLWLVALAEFGDKTQLLVAWLATRHRRAEVLAGVALGSLAIHFISAAAGGLIGELVPDKVMDILAGALFLGFGVLAIASAGRADEEDGERGSRWPVLGVALTFFVAELGDKTQLVALSRAAQYSANPGISAFEAFAGVWAGAVAAMLLIDGLAVLAGAWLHSRVSSVVLARLSGLAFLAVGAYTLLGAALD